MSAFGSLADVAEFVMVDRCGPVSEGPPLAHDPRVRIPDWKLLPFECYTRAAVGVLEPAETLAF